MKYQIDQSGKIEQTSLNTIIALANDKQYSLLLSKKSKRILQQFFRVQNKSQVFIYLTFAILVTIILKEVKPKNKVIIDSEYPGHEALIKNIIKNTLKQFNISTPPLEFNLVGKSSPAHDLAAKVAHNKKKANKKVSLEEVLKIILGNKKRSGIPLLTGPRAT
jgi:hypothetical protein